MRPGRLHDGVEDLGDFLDRAAGRLHPRAERIGPVPGKDRQLIRVFPYFIAVCLVLWLCSVLYIGDYSFAKLLEVLCLVFVACFAILGVPCVLVMDRGVFSNWVMFGFAVAMALLLWITEIYTDEVYYAEAIQGIMTALNHPLEGAWQYILGFLGTLAILFFTSAGVLSVIGAYMREYVGNVFLAMQARAGTGRRGKAEWFFMVPDIVDVEEVVMEPIPQPHIYHVSTALRVSLYLFVLGLLVSSYLFVNPLLISVMGWKTMLAVTMMLSMFTPALVLPWIIVRGVGAKVRTSAPRDYYLWTGARKRLFSTFLTLGVFMMMFVLSVYLGNSVTSIILTYLSFLVPLLATSLMYGAMYANSFDGPVCRTICEKFEEGKEDRDNPRGPST